jgi:hypothetical protein
MVTEEVLTYILLSILCLLGYFASKYNAEEYEQRTGKTSYVWIICGVLNIGCVILNAVKALMLLS